MKNELLELLKSYTLQKGVVADSCFTAIFLSNEVGLSRNVVSQYLNEYVLSGQVIKINSRPVYFYEVSALEEIGYTITNSVYNSFNEVKNKVSDFDKLIGSKGSLFHCVEQCKASIGYPPNGLPVILHGATGTGKSVIAKTMYEYGVNNNIISKDGKFIVLNCSEYANNPELLTANLFGHKKGAYTGADRDNPGLIQLADGGMLFLDEVHCLKAESQEKLFLFMDKGEYHRVGDNENWYHSNCRLVFATTEKPEDALLRTLLRRIPISIHVPSLVERGIEEKQALISSVFKNESKEIKKNIEISYLAYQVLMDTDIPGNVGGLLNCIKASCANAFLNHSNEDGNLKIYSYDLPDYILQLAPTINFKIQDNNDIKMMNLTHPVQTNTYDSKLLVLYNNIIQEYKKYSLNPLNANIFSSEVMKNIELYNDHLMFTKNNAQNLNKDFTTKITDKIFSIMMNKYSLKISNNDILIISRYISEYTRSGPEIKSWLIEHESEVASLIELLQIKYPREYAIASEIALNIHLNLDIELDSLMKVRLMLMINDFKADKTHEDTIAIILCHGYSTASSIAGAINKMIGKNIYEAIDMQLELSSDKITNQLNDFLKAKHYFNNLILLVDMGSLEEIYKGIKLNDNVNIGIINNVNTKLALDIGFAINNGLDIKETLIKASETNVSQFRYIDAGIRKSAILSVCATGVGAANKIIELFEKSLPTKINSEIIAYDYQKLIENGNNDPIFDKYDVSFIIGTMNPYVEDVPFIAIEDLVVDNDLDKLTTLMEGYLSEEHIETLRSNIIKNFTLNNIVNYLTILNAEKVLEDVECVVSEIETGLNRRLAPGSKMGLYVHLSCLIERLMLKDEIKLTQGVDEFINENKEFVEVVRNAFSVVKYGYSVELPNSEIPYIFNYIKNN